MFFCSQNQLSFRTYLSILFIFILFTPTLAIGCDNELYQVFKKSEKEARIELNKKFKEYTEALYTFKFNENHESQFSRISSLYIQARYDAKHMLDFAERYRDMGARCRNNYNAKKMLFDEANHIESEIEDIFFQLKEKKEQFEAFIEENKERSKVSKEINNLPNRIKATINTFTDYKREYSEILAAFSSTIYSCDQIKEEWFKNKRDTLEKEKIKFESGMGKYKLLETLENGSLYQGDWRGNYPHGSGAAKKNGNVIIGEWVDGELWDVSYFGRNLDNWEKYGIASIENEYMFERRAIVSSQANIYKSFLAREDDLIYQVERYYPILVLFEFESFYKIQDFEGDKGWVRKTDVGNVPTVVLIRDFTVRSEPSAVAQLKFSAEKGLPFKVLKREGEWVQVEHSDGDTGWIYQSVLW